MKSIKKKTNSDADSCPKSSNNKESNRKFFLLKVLNLFLTVISSNYPRYLITQLRSESICQFTSSSIEI